MFLHYLCLAAAFLSLASTARAQEDPVSFSGIVTNTTNPKNPISAEAAVSVKGKDCYLRISAPLVGSGVCSVTKLDAANGALAFESEGPAGNVTLEGVTKGNEFTGTYTVSYPNFREIEQHGTFQLHLDEKAAPLSFNDVLEVAGFEKDGKPYKTLRERETIYIYDTDFKYQGGQSCYQDRGP